MYIASLIKNIVPQMIYSYRKIQWQQDKQLVYNILVIIHHLVLSVLRAL